jgi:Ca2+-transporting ATPase
MKLEDSAIPNIEPGGLSEAAATERFRTEGPNELPTAKPKNILEIGVEILREPMLLLLIAASTVYLVLGNVKEAIALAISIFVVIGIELYQETKTERTLQALRDLASPRALVIRDGRRKRIAGREVVRGDLLVLSEGDRVAADALVVSAVNLTCDESLLTGESVPVRKAVWDGRSTEIPRPGGDNIAAVFSGTLVVKGFGTAVVTSSGSNTGNRQARCSPEKHRTRNHASRIGDKVSGKAVRHDKHCLVPDCCIRLWPYTGQLAKWRLGRTGIGNLTGSGRIPSRPGNLPGAGRMAHFPQTRAHTPRSRNRNARLRNGIVRR